MRTGVLKKQIEELYKNLTIKSEDITSGGNTYKKIINWKSINFSLHALNEYKFMGDSINDIFKSGANFIASTDSTAILASNYTSFVNQFNIVKAKCESIMNMEANGNDDENSLYVKLPYNLKTLEELDFIVKGLNTSINQCPILRDTYKELNFTGVDVGSSWLILTAILTGAPIMAKSLNWIADFIKKCNDIRIQNRTIKKMDLEYLITKMGLEEKVAEKALKTAKDNLELENRENCLKEFEEIKIPLNRKISEEEKNKITYCMLTMAELLDMGVEIYPSINASEEIKSAFPKKEEWKKIDGQVKMLKEASNKE